MRLSRKSSRNKGCRELLAAANATTTIPVLGTSVTDYADTFANNILANVSGTSDAVPFAEQAQMMIDTLKLFAQASGREFANDRAILG